MTDAHTAAASGFGYLIQPDRLLYLLSEINSNEVAGFEVDDDLSVRIRNGNVSIREQSKASVSNNASPFSNRSKDLWNTLYIWVKGLNEDKFTIDEISLHLTTNVSVPPHYIVHRIDKLSESSKSEELADKLFAIMKNPPDSLKSQVKYIKDHRDDLIKLLPKIQLLDLETTKNLDSKTINNLPLIPEHASDILTHMKGWVHEQIVSKIEKQELALISKESFSRQLNVKMAELSINKIKSRMRAVVEKELSEKNIQAARKQTFVKQLNVILEDEDEDIILDAIINYLCTESEKTRLVEDGEVMELDFEECETDCKQRWNLTFRLITKRSSSTQKNHVEIGYEIFYRTIDNFDVKIKGSAPNKYFTKGIFHHLANNLEIGWHPEWAKLFKN